MSEEKSWDDLVEGIDCPFCRPQEDRNEYSIRVADLTVSTLFLKREQIFRGYCVLVFNSRHVAGLEQLSDDEYKSFLEDLHKSLKAVYRAVHPDHMNYAALGNSIPHLHYHIIPRYKGDPRWRSNPFLKSEASDKKSGEFDHEAEYDQLASEINKYI